ncbi:MAG: ABC transporter substrate-binding protein [Hyphomicrobiales bacterium]|nr:MAG: ABC transporter substrate-binding protein [Hyphomicrobiales bacterium]
MLPAKLGRAVAASLLALALSATPSLAQDAKPARAQDAPMGEAYTGPVGNPPHGIAMHGSPALPADFTHLPYANPSAPKGGRIGWGFQGVFDSMNVFIRKGAVPLGMFDSTLGPNVYEGLMFRSYDEPFTMYGLIAETIKTDPERTFLEITIRPEAKFSDGVPITVDDVLFTIDMLREKGAPHLANRMKAITSVERIGDNGLRMNFADGSNRELPLLIGLVPIVPKHAITEDEFGETTMTPFIGSGPYVVESVKPGTRVVMKRNPDYWGKDLPIKRGLDNFDELIVDYYRNETSRFEAFRTGLFDINGEGSPIRWSKEYDFPAVQKGDIVLNVFETKTPVAMQAMVFNVRRPMFSDERVRQALTLLFDFEWVNANLFNNQYVRTASLFQNSELSSYQRPISEAERAILGDHISQIDQALLDGTYAPPKSDGSGNDRTNLRQALKLLQQAGYGLVDGKMTNKATGEQLSFEFMGLTRAHERLALAFQRNMMRLGIDMQVRTVDSSQYWQRWLSFDFDMLMRGYSASLSPGTEQFGRWGSAASENPGTQNIIGANSPAIDAALDALVAARDRGDFVAAVRAFDRAVMSGTYFIPLYHAPGQRVARRTRIAVPKTTSIYGYQSATWWETE